VRQEGTLTPVCQEAGTGKARLKEAIVIVQDYAVTSHRNRYAYGEDLPGCFAAAATRQECERRMREAGPFHLESLQRQDERMAAAARGAPRE
jgi:hypothetical protein